MKRKLVKQGVSTLMVSLPSKWIKANSLEKGSEVDINEKENLLIIGGNEKKAEKKEITIHLTEDNRHDIRNMLTHLYRRGFDRITIKNTNPEDITEIRKATSLLLGFDIVDKTNDFCIIDNITEPSAEKYEVIIRRAFLIIKETHRILSEDLESGKITRFIEIEEHKRQQDKHILFCRRIITKETGRHALEWELLTFLMHIEHKYYYLYRYANDNKYRQDAQLKDLLKQLGRYFEMFYDAYFQKDIKKIHDINKARNEFYFNKCFKALERSQGKKSVMISQIAEIYRLIQVGTSPILSGLIEAEINN